MRISSVSWFRDRSHIKEGVFISVYNRRAQPVMCSHGNRSWDSWLVTYLQSGGKEKQKAGAQLIFLFMLLGTRAHGRMPGFSDFNSSNLTPLPDLPRDLSSQ